MGSCIVTNHHHNRNNNNNNNNEINFKEVSGDHHHHHHPVAPSKRSVGNCIIQAAVHCSAVIAGDELARKLDEAMKRAESLRFNPEEVIYLRKSFDCLIREKREPLTNAIYSKFIEKMPDALVKLQSAVRLNDRWEQSAVVLNFLSGIERCLLRIDHPAALFEYVKKLVQTHVKIRDVSAEMLRRGLVVLEEAITQMFDASLIILPSRNTVTIMKLDSCDAYHGRGVVVSLEPASQDAVCNNGDDDDNCNCSTSSTDSLTAGLLLWKRFFLMMVNLVEITELSLLKNEAAVAEASGGAFILNHHQQSNSSSRKNSVVSSAANQNNKKQANNSNYTFLVNSKSTSSNQSSNHSNKSNHSRKS